jgi:hypothetical protein
MMSYRWPLFVILLALTGCLPTSSGDGGPSTRPVGEGPPRCLEPCETELDCLGGTPTTSKDNYQCIDGGCVWQGCVSSDECREEFGAEYTCRDSRCAETCLAEEDCDSRFEACIDGICEYAGCTSDSSCNLGEDNDFACRDFPGFTQKQCVARCTSDSTCIQIYRSPLFECSDGTCITYGCTSDDQCVGICSG